VQQVAEAAGFSVDTGWVRTVAQHRAFDRAGCIGWITSQCFQAYEAHMPEAMHAGFRAEVLARVDELQRRDGTYDETFVRLDVLARCPSR